MAEQDAMIYAPIAPLFVLSVSGIFGSRLVEMADTLEGAKAEAGIGGPFIDWLEDDDGSATGFFPPLLYSIERREPTVDELTALKEQRVSLETHP